MMGCCTVVGILNGKSEHFLRKRDRPVPHHTRLGMILDVITCLVPVIPMGDAPRFLARDGRDDPRIKSGDGHDVAVSSPAAAGREGDPPTRSALWIPFPSATLRPGMTLLSSKWFQHRDGRDKPGHDVRICA